MEKTVGVLSGVLLPLLLCGAGLYFLCTVGGKILRHPCRAIGAIRGRGAAPQWKNLIREWLAGATGAISPRQLIFSAIFLALKRFTFLRNGKK